MKTVGCITIKKGISDLEEQLTVIKGEVTVDRFITVDLTGSKDISSMGFADFVNELDAETLVCVSSLSKLGKSTEEMLRHITMIMDKGAQLIAVCEDFRLNIGTNEFKTGVLKTVNALIEAENAITKERTRSAFDTARKKGKKPGRPKGVKGKSKLTGKENQIRRMLRDNVSKSAIARILSVSRTTLVDFINSRKLED